MISPNSKLVIDGIFGVIPHAGYAVAAEDAQALADAVLKMYRLPAAERARMGEAGREYYHRHFDREQLLNWLEEIMKQSVEEKACAS